MSRAVSAFVLIALGVASTARAQDEEEPLEPTPDVEVEADGGAVPWYQRGRDDEAAPEAEAAPATTPAPAPAPEPVPVPASEDEDEDDDDDEHTGGFYFGSYGRIIAASDLAGRTGRQNLITAWGPRVDEADTYAEIELRREDHFAGMDTTVVATIGYFGPLFHYDGELSERIAFRNLYARVGNLLTPGLNVWAGSRMWRGDDIYLFNFWPLDSLNMVGGGLSYDLEQIGQLRIAAGLAQPNDPFQRQEVLVPARDGFSPESVLFLDRPRAVAAARLTWWPFGRRAREGMKAILYGEGHYLPSGTRRNPEGFDEALPEDAGWVVGAQLGGYLADQNAFANLFVRYARGLGVYDPLGVPFRTGSVIQTGRAEELRIALSANWEEGIFGLQVGGYYRYFRDADPNVYGRGTLTEGALNVRPMIWLDRYVGIAADLSYSGMAAASIDESTGNAVGGNLFKLGIVPFVTPFGRGTYTRPHLRLIYTLTVRDDGARALYPALDPRSANTVEHFFGIGVEWWFSSSSYGS
ncbi:MAG: carbohydrate porin [Sandaracinaceae bacterium]|nr:carbohydrate porin [Sandaracinaceae bacterium]